MTDTDEQGHIDHVYNHGTSKEVMATFVDHTGRTRWMKLEIGNNDGSDLNPEEVDGLLHRGITATARGDFSFITLTKRLKEGDRV